MSISISRPRSGSEDDIQLAWVGHPILAHVDDSITRESTISGKSDWTVPLCRVAWVDDGTPILRTVEIRGSLGRKILAQWGEDHRQNPDHWVLLHIISLGSAQTAYRGWTSAPPSDAARIEAETLEEHLPQLLGKRPTAAQTSHDRLRTVGLSQWGQQ